MQDLPVYFRVLADRKRFQILCYLAQHDEVAVSDLGMQLHMSQPLISWHLRKMRRIGLVTTRRSGRMVLCSLDRPALRRYQHSLDEALGLYAPATDDTVTGLGPALSNY